MGTEKAKGRRVVTRGLFANDRALSTTSAVNMSINQQQREFELQHDDFEKSVRMNLRLSLPLGHSHEHSAATMFPARAVSMSSQKRKRFNSNIRIRIRYNLRKPNQLHLQIEN
ncbi:MAG: hypothetical protein ACLGPL_05750 [Acidobacteriota bacterium]